LRSLKQTVRLHSLTARSLDMVAKELVLGLAAYNLVRATMYAAPRGAGLGPRQLSFLRARREFLGRLFRAEPEGVH